jgi:3alpha(or 20beta)-hydroxysteroid dehydrogenase
MSELDGKVVLVTGGASGIGAGVAAFAAERGAIMVTADIDDAASPDHIRLDVSDEAQWITAVDRIRQRHGRLDALVHAAGILQGEAILDFERAMFDRVMRVNLTGTFLAIKHCGPAIVAAGGGAIVTLSSVEGLQGSNSMAAYGASKWGVRGLTKAAAFELGEAGVRVNSVHPGPIDTPMVNPQGRPPAEMATRLSMFDRMPIARMGRVEEVAALCAYLMSDAARFVTGAEFVIDGGLTAGNPVGTATRRALA